MISSSAVTVSNKEREEIAGERERDRQDENESKLVGEGEEQSEKGQCELLHLIVSESSATHARCMPTQKSIHLSSQCSHHHITFTRLYTIYIALPHGY